MAIDWFRMWHETPTDPKWRTIAKESGQDIALVITTWLFLLVNASCNAVKRGETINFVSEDVANALDVETEKIDLILSSMQGRVLAGKKIISWEKRQPKREDSTSTERVRRFRERRETQCNATKRSETLDKDKDKDKDIKKKYIKKKELDDWEPPPWLNQDAWSDFVDMRKRIKKPLRTQKGVNSIVNKLSKLSVDDQALVIQKSVEREWLDVFPENLEKLKQNIGDYRDIRTGDESSFASSTAPSPVGTLLRHCAERRKKRNSDTSENN